MSTDIKASVLKNAPLLNYTTLRMGGPAEMLVTVQTTQQLQEAVEYAQKENMPITVLGGGTNVLISDNGIRGMVIRNQSSTMTIEEVMLKTKFGNSASKILHRWQSDKTTGRFIGIEFNDLNYDESDKPNISVEIESGYSLQRAIFELIEKGITGLQWFAGIPGTIGGAVFNNIHGGSRFFSEFIDTITILKDGKSYEISSGELDLDYDKSRFHNSSEIILKVKLKLFQGDKDRAMFTATEWKKRKMVQPRNSPGCLFKNITNAEKEKLGYPTTGTGYIIDKILNMRGYTIGDAMVSDVHCNFLINNGKATSKDYLALIKLIHTRIKNELGLNVTPEIVFLGFDPQEVSELYV